ncbi:MAG TPA: DUF4129 domain-containing protein [Pirellulales bacterium]|nr:DUF4129 domain-containing protein [Pirellulales bacterium]
MADWIRWLMWAVLAVAAIVGFIMYRSQVIAFVRKLWAELLAVLGELFGRRRAHSTDAVESETFEPPHPFSAFRNPFHSGKVSHLSPDQLVRYTFDALEAWTFERGAARRREETPLEFAEALRRRFPQLAADVRQLARLYSELVYARTSPGRDCLPVLQRLWEEMSRAGQRPDGGAAEAAVAGATHQS